ncbi:DUF3558 family protein [Saccharothrix obliqua]|uniref:DUF3558 family protein n=1 Tax=Saccharothrix obliqua TaxID=2861747 RepID=UPI001C6077B1|nr:hypothetical protein [Saccharothrix obliqua]MBW4721974.1 hypothetical protein [Saccharothrix obliqua]
MIGSRRWAPLVLALVAFLGGCGVQVAGTPVPVPNPTPWTTPKPDPTAAALLGDLPTLDPCGLVDPADVARFGAAEAGPVESLDHCAVKLTTPGGALLDVSAGLLDEVATEGELNAEVRTYSGGLRIAVEKGDTARCARRLVFSDLITLTVSVDNFSGGAVTAAGMCDVADVATEAVARRVLAKEVRHRAFQPKSLGRIDPCTAVTPSSVARVPGLATAKVRRYPAAHQCRWSPDGTAAPPRMRVTFSAGVPSQPDGKNVTAEDVAGRPATVSRSGGGSVVLCGVETAHIPFEGGVRELAIVTVTLPPGGQVDAACEAAKAIAGDVWSKLPR